jgi:hypothetical protein
LSLRDMTLAAPQTFAKRTIGLLSKVAPDRRKHKRIAATLRGRFMRANREEHPCRTIDISVGGIRIASNQTLTVGERIVAQFDELGSVEGAVVRIFEGGFVMSLSATVAKREKIAAVLTFLANRNLPSAHPERRHERLVPGNPNQPLTLTEGLTITCTVMDVSLSGASVATPARPTIGTEVLLGSLKAKVMRHHETGIGLAFIDIQTDSSIRRTFG